MQIVLILLKQCAVMFVLIAVGYILYRKKLLSDSGSKELSNILVRLIMPCVIINAYITADFSREKLLGLGVMFALSMLALILSMIVSYVFFRRKKRTENFGTAFSNAGFMGIPLVQATLGADAVFFVAVFVALLNIFQWTYGLAVITGDKKYISLKKVITNPVLVALVIAFVGYVIPVEIPSVISLPISYIGNMNTPVAMLVLGVYLAQTDMAECVKDTGVWLCCFARLIVIPLATILIFALLPLGSSYEMIKQTALIASITPVGSNVAIFAKLYDADYEQAVRIVCLSTVLCIITMPCVMYAAALT